MLTDSDEDVKVAKPELSVPVPIVVAPSLNVTVPVGVTEPDTCVTVAVNVTDCPNTDGFVDEVTVVVLPVVLTLIGGLVSVMIELFEVLLAVRV